jgi:prepilin-type N-terminal cleavage/methylation domain-containing protein
MRITSRARRGLTLFELVVGIMVVGLLAVVVVFSLSLLNSKNHDLVPETKWMAQQLDEYRAPAGPKAAESLVTRIQGAEAKWNIRTHVVSFSHTEKEDKATLAFSGSSQRTCLYFKTGNSLWAEKAGTCK